MLLQLLTEHDLDNAGHVFAVGAVAVVEEVSHAERVAIFVDFDNGKFDTWRLVDICESSEEIGIGFGLDVLIEIGIGVSFETVDALSVEVFFFVVNLFDIFIFFNFYNTLLFFNLFDTLLFFNLFDLWFDLFASWCNDRFFNLNVWKLF